jgi:hypothetical protein
MKRSDMIVKRDGHNVCVIGKYIYAIGGRRNGNNGEAAIECERYNILKNTWN